MYREKIALVQLDKGREKVGKGKRIKRQAVLLPVAAAAVVIGLLIFVLLRSSDSSAGTVNINVQKIAVDGWRKMDLAELENLYEGTVTSNETAPFAVIVGSRDDKDFTPRMVYMENGKGTVRVSWEDALDPSEAYRPIGYMEGRQLDESEISRITCEVRDYYDWKPDTACTFDIEAELSGGDCGFLCFEVRNNLTDEVSANCWMPVIDGKGSYLYLLSGLALNTRGAEASVTPKLFCPAKPLEETDYTLGEFSVEREEGMYYTELQGRRDITLSGQKNVLILYTSRLKADEKGRPGELMRDQALLAHGTGSLITYLIVDTDEKGFEPEYEFEIIGYAELEEPASS